MLRIGQGYDVHCIVPDRPLILGGVRIPWDRGLLGHSDADVLLHAITDACLGALALGDIGQWFPDTDLSYRGADSADLLRTVLRSPQFAGWRLLNLDATIMAQAPKMVPHIPAMRQCLAKIFATELHRISVKATTTERLGFVGRQEGLAASAVVLLQHQSSVREK
jgi:2-C-methyl-D-erythritol 2,4-cyclodiphosphate synthase